MAEINDLTNTIANRIVDTRARSLRIIDIVTQLERPTSGKINLNRFTSDDVRQESVTRITPSEATTEKLEVDVNRERFGNFAATLREEIQGLEGGYIEGLANDAAGAVANAIDDQVVEDHYASGGLTTDWHVNVAGDAITIADISEAKAKLMDQDGDHNLAWLIQPYAEASISNITVPVGDLATQGQVGIQRIGTLLGVPAFVTNGVKRRRRIISSEWDVTTGTLTVTVGEGHGVVEGMLVSFDTVTSGGDLSTPTAVTSVTATTIVIDSSGLSAGAQVEAGTVVVESAESLLVDLPYSYAAQALVPTIRLVPDYDSGNTAVQVRSLFGAANWPGRCVVLHSPATLS